MARTRRALRRRSTATRIDRSADVPTKTVAGVESMGGNPGWGQDGARGVELEDDALEEATGVDFWLEQRPPHFGGES